MVSFGSIVICILMQQRKLFVQPLCFLCDRDLKYTVMKTSKHFTMFDRFLGGTSFFIVFFLYTLDILNTKNACTNFCATDSLYKYPAYYLILGTIILFNKSYFWTSVRGAHYETLGFTFLASNLSSIVGNVLTHQRTCATYTHCSLKYCASLNLAVNSKKKVKPVNLYCFVHCLYLVWIEHILKISMQKKKEKKIEFQRTNINKINKKKGFSFCTMFSAKKTKHTCMHVMPPNTNTQTHTCRLYSVNFVF